MLRNKFRRGLGILIVLLFGVAVYQYIQKAGHSEYVGGALSWGAKMLLVLALILWVVYRFDRRTGKKTE